MKWPSSNGDFEFDVAQIVVIENNANFFSRTIGRFTHSRATHCFLIISHTEAVEAIFPRVRTLFYHERLREMIAQGRAFAVLDLPRLPNPVRRDIAAITLSYTGAWFDAVTIVVRALLGRFLYRDRASSFICSRLVTKAYMQVGIDLFPPDTLRDVGLAHQRNLREGYATPCDLLKSMLTVVAFSPSLTAPTLATLIAT